MSARCASRWRFGLPLRARAIIEYREQYGRFTAVEEAAAVPGLTEAVVEEWDGLAYVS